ncbi:MAG: LysR family transcriptional regulator [Devosia sp.]
MSEFSLRQLQVVAAIHRAGKIVHASKQLGLTQPAVSLQLQEAESRAGTPLFHRTPDGMRPTAAGEAVIDAALLIEERLRILSDEMAAIAIGRRGRLRLGVVSTAKYFAPPMIAAFMREQPGVEISLFVGNRAETINNLRDRRVDVALMGRPPQEFPVRSVLFGQHPFVIVAPPSHPLAQEKGIVKERIAAESFLIREAGSGTRLALDMYLSELPGRLDDPGTEMGSNETIKQAVMAGLGIALISGHTIALELELGRIVVLDVEGMPIRRQWFLVSRADHVLTPAMTSFEDFLQSKGRSFLPQVAGT